jgi:hypothetical protein
MYYTEPALKKKKKKKKVTWGSIIGSFAVPLAVKLRNISYLIQ